VIPNYQQFFITFIPSSQTIATLKVLLALAVEINADMKWVAYLENPAQVLVEASWLNIDE
jgi:hypothetical protein